MMRLPETKDELFAWFLLGGVVLTVIIIVCDTVKLLRMGTKKNRYQTGEQHGEI